MTVIIANGETEIYGVQSVRIIGTDKAVQRIICGNQYFRNRIKKSISESECYIANSYYPPADSMLQAYATLLYHFGESNVKIIGDIETIPMDGPKGCVY